MSYLFYGELCGYICPECPEAISNVTVRLYRVREAEGVARQAVAREKETLGILDDETVQQKADDLLVEATTDGAGRFAVELSEEQQQYAGGPFELDVYCETVPHRKPDAPSAEPLQFTVTTIQPHWREAKDGYMAQWEYCIPQRFWCAVRARFHAWTICGRVLDCDNETALAGVTVSAFDTDWVQHDSLGEAVSDGEGRFRIDYHSSDFKKTPLSPLFNLELVGGPDLYFTAESAGVTVLEESPSRGRQPDRENAGPCFCVELCVETPPPPVNNPWFTHIGDLHVYGDIDTTTGLTTTAFAGHGGPGYGFFGGLKLKGFCPKTSPTGSAPMRYRFLYEHPDDPGHLVPVTGSALVAPVVVGARLIQWKLSDNTLDWTFQSIVIAPTGATADPTPKPPGPGPWGAPPNHVIVPDSDGWVNVDQNALDNGFYGPLIRFRSTGAVPGGPAPADVAGNPVTDPKDGVDLKLVFEATPVGTSSPPDHSNQADKVHVNNWVEVRQLDLDQFRGPGNDSCSPLTSDLDVLYTVDHELLDDWSLAIESASSSAPGQVIPPYPAGATPRGHVGSHHENISSWENCSYRVWLRTRRKLTNGEIDDDFDGSLQTFCK